MPFSLKCVVPHPSFQSFRCILVCGNVFSIVDFYLLLIDISSGTVLEVSENMSFLGSFFIIRTAWPDLAFPINGRLHHFTASGKTWQQILCWLIG